MKPTNWDAAGCSYLYNAYTVPIQTKKPLASPSGLALRDLDWVPDPVRFILMYEPPAAPGGTVDANFGYGYCYHWHFAKGRTVIHPKDLQSDSQPFISPILFVDGHAAKHDFTKTIKADPRHPFEETKDWMWYSPALPQPSYGR